MTDITVEEIVESHLEQKSRSDIHTNIVGNHMSQMALFGIRGGVEFYPQEDINGDRALLIERLITESKLELYFRSIWAHMVGEGSTLFYLRPTKDFYQIMWFWKNQFEIFYGEDGNSIQKVVIAYPFDVKDEFGSLKTRQWIRLTITKDEIRQGVYDHNPSILYLANTPNETVVQNTLGVVPCIVVDNDPSMAGHRGESDFAMFESQILEHNKIAGAIVGNVQFFGNPTLITTRPAQQVVEAAFSTAPQYRGAATGSGFQNPAAGIYSTRKHDYSRTDPQDVRIKRIIGSVQPDERIGYIQPDPVTGDMNQIEAIMRENIRTALGGVDENSISAGATALEIKSLYGRAAATAKRKAEQIYTFGLCKLLELAIVFEEFLFMESFKQVTGWDVEKNGELTKDQVRQFLMGDPEQGIEPQPLPPGVIGILPQGNPKVHWRWKGPVFEPSALDRQQDSIVMRNLTEEGISTLEALKVIYPDKTEDEINALLGGVPFRRGQRIIGMIQQVAALHSQLLQTPSAAVPNVPLGAFVGQPLEQVIMRLTDKLNEELNRGQNKSDDRFPDILRQFGAGVASDELIAGGMDAEQPIESEPGDSDSDESSGQQQPDPEFLLSNFGTTGYAAPTGVGWTSLSRGATDATATGTGDSLSRYLSRRESEYGPNASTPGSAAGIFPGEPFTDVPTGNSGAPGDVPPGYDPARNAPATGGVYGAGGGRSYQPFEYASMGQQSLRPEYLAPVPPPGSTVAQRNRQLPWNGGSPTNVPGADIRSARDSATAANYGPAGNTDIRPNSNKWRRLFPTAAAILDRIAGANGK